jgi:hypothetical protein
LDEILLILPAVQELSGQLLGEPKMRGDDFIKDLLPPDGPRCLSLQKQLMGTFGQLLTARMLILRDDRGGDD